MHDFSFKRGNYTAKMFGGFTGKTARLATSSIRTPPSREISSNSTKHLRRSTTRFVLRQKPIQLGRVRTLANAGSGFDLRAEVNCSASSRRAATCQMHIRRRRKRRGNELALKKASMHSTPRANRAIRITVARHLKKGTDCRTGKPECGRQDPQNYNRHLLENKFGTFEEVEEITSASKLKNLHIRGLQMHIGSQLTEGKKR